MMILVVELKLPMIFYMYKSHEQTLKHHCMGLCLGEVQLHLHRHVHVNPANVKSPKKQFEIADSRSLDD